MTNIDQINKIISKINVFVKGHWFGNIWDKTKFLGIQKSDMRKYEYWDNSKYINRKASTKTQEIIINQFQKDSNLVLDFFLDLNQNRLWWYEKSHIYSFFDFLDNLKLTKNNIQFNINFRDLDTKNIDTTKDLNSDFDKKIENLQKKIIKQIKNNKSDYISNLDNMTKYMSKLQHKSVIIVFSDFLDLDSNQIFQKYIQINNKNLFCFELDIYNIWLDFNWFFA